MLKLLVLTASMLASLCTPTTVFAQTETYDTVKAAFILQLTNHFNLDPTASNPDAAAYVTKPFIAETIMAFVNNSPASFQYIVQNAVTIVPPPQEIYTAIKAEASQECSRDQYCNFPCDQKWPWDKAGCEINKEFCKDTQKFDCERVKSMSQLISGKKIATISFKEVSLSGSASASKIKATITKQLDHITLAADIAAQINISMSGYVSPEQLIVATGCFKHEFKFLDEQVEMKESNFVLSSQIALETEGDHVNVTTVVDKPTVTLRFAATPALRFLSRNPLSFLACPVPYAIAGIADIVAPNDTAKLALEIPIDSKKIKVAVITQQAEGLTLTVVPKAAPLYVGMEMSVSGF